MKKLGRILLICAVALCVLLPVVISFTIGWRPFIGPKKRALTSRQFERTPERVARGRYLVGVLGCESCHSPKEWRQHGAAAVAGKSLAGESKATSGFTGTDVAANLEPDP